MRYRRVFAERQEDPSIERPGHGRLIMAAWLGTLLLSRLPQIVLREGFGIEAGWMPAAWIGIGVVLALLGAAFAVLSPLRPYFLVMTLVAAVSAIDPVVRDTDVWRALVPGDADTMTTLLSERVLLVGLAVIMMVVLIWTGSTRLEAYLVVGSMSAPSGIRLPGREGLRWSIVGQSPVRAISSTQLIKARENTAPSNEDGSALQHMSHKDPDKP